MSATPDWGLFYPTIDVKDPEIMGLMIEEPSLMTLPFAIEDVVHADTFTVTVPITGTLESETFSYLGASLEPGSWLLAPRGTSYYHYVSGSEGKEQHHYTWSTDDPESDCESWEVPGTWRLVIVTLAEPLSPFDQVSYHDPETGCHITPGRGEAWAKVGDEGRGKIHIPFGNVEDDNWNYVDLVMYIVTEEGTLDMRDPRLWLDSWPSVLPGEYIARANKW